MKSRLIFRALIASGVILAGSVAYGQDSARSGANGTAAPKKAAIKPHKVWTDEDMGSGRRADSLYIPATSVEGAGSATATPPASASKEASAENSAPKGKAPALSNPKSPAEADGMIEWEQRDIDAQQEFVDRMQAEMEQASPERREHLQKVIAERQQALADTRREQQGLIAQKKELQKKAAGTAVNNSVASSQSPQ